METLQQRLKSLVNIAKRVHHTEQKRTEILDDLKAISEKEYEELAEGHIIDKETTAYVSDIVSREYHLQKMCWEATCFENDNRQIPHPEPPAELPKLQALIQQLNK